jgi:signal transduction histidine kinase
VPIVFAGVAAGASGGSALGLGVTGVRSSVDGPATLHMALALHPRTRQVYLVAPAAAPDSVAASSGWSSFRESEFRVAFHRLPVEPLPQLLDRLAQLPENSLVMHVAEFGAGTGSTVPPLDPVEEMARASRAPIYGIADDGVGHGVVGAVATSTDAIGRATAHLVGEVLSRRAGAGLPAVRTLAATPQFDWRELRRWGVRRRQLPPGSIVRFKPPSFWRQHLALVTTTGGLILLQTGLILALVLQSRRRRLAEREAQRRRQELAHMTRVATMGELTASLAHEINQPLAAILTNARAAQRLLAAGNAEREEIGEILADIAADDQRAGEVIRRMRALLRKDESAPMTLDVNDLVTEVVGLVRGEMILQNVSLALELLPGLPRVHGDRIQLQQVLLNLMMNALDAMKETSGGNRKVTVRSSAPDARTVQVSVEDAGTGLPVDKFEEVFEPFVTTKPHGMGLGLAICRSIIQSHGGRIGSANNTDRGATFWFTLPAEDVKR